MTSELLRIIRGLPGWIAWRIDAFAARLRDAELSPPVRDAWDE
jgi:hypothetical protein